MGDKENQFDMPQPRLKGIERKQTFLRMVDIEGLVDEDHEVRAIWDFVGRLNLSHYYEDIRAVEGTAGREAIDPQLLISLWIYACGRGVSSAREIERLCGYHPAYQWLCGSETVNHHTLSDFRIKHKEALDELFSEILCVLSAEGMVKLERVMHDGTKIKAFASADSFRREERIQAHLELARQQVAQMGDPLREENGGAKKQAAKKRAARERQERLEAALSELEKIRSGKHGDANKAEARASWSDPEARVMKQSDGGYAPSYNIQISTDSEAGVIVGMSASQSGSDYEELQPAVEEIERRNGKKPDQIVVDGGYTSRDNVLAMNEGKIDLIAPTITGERQSVGQMKRRKVVESFAPVHFRYDEADNKYICPAGKSLHYDYKEQRPGLISYRYRAAFEDCLACHSKNICCPENASHGRAITRSFDTPEILEFRAKMETAEAKEIYRQRGGIAEFPNAWIKEKFGIRQFRLRGRIKVFMEILWAGLTYNIKQWIRLRRKPHRLAVVGC